VKLVILGDSHTKALSDALAAEPPVEGLQIECKPICSGVAFRSRFHEVGPQGVTFVDPRHRERLAMLSGSPVFVSSPDVTYGLVMGFHTAAICRNRTWTRHAPAGVATRLGLQAVSTQVIREISLHEKRNVFAFFDDLKAAGVRFFAISAPQPRRSHPCLRQGIGEATLLAVDRLVREICAEKLQADGIAACLPPREAEDGDGFLLPKYEQRQEGDDHHANAAYGAIMLRRAIHAAAGTDALRPDPAPGPAGPEAPAENDGGAKRRRVRDKLKVLLGRPSGAA